MSPIGSTPKVGCISTLTKNLLSATPRRSLLCSQIGMRTHGTLLKAVKRPCVKCRPDGKSAVRGTFNALEAVFRLKCPRAPKLTRQDAQERLTPLLRKAHAEDRAASSASGKLPTTFKEWIDAAHFYRHEQGMPDKIAQPPLQLAILLSTGPAHLRWSAELDAQCAIAEAVTAK
jgi:hypothetical protein